MSKPDAPTPPNPIATAAAQTGTNVSTAVANSYLNNMNQNTPDGSLRFDVTGNHSWTDPSTNQTYNIPTFTSTQELSDQGKAIKGQTDAARMNLAGMANSQSARLAGLLGSEMDVSGAPAMGNMDWLHSTGFAKTDFDKGWDITRSYGPADNFSADRQRVEDSLMQRMNPQLERERSSIENRLADQGIRYGSQAYTSAMDDYNRQSNDARFAAVGQAGTEQQRMMDMAAQRASFENAAQGQNFQQNAALGSFYNAGTAQNLARNQSIWNAQNAQRNQYLQEAYQKRNQPINEITSLLSGSQMQNPQWLNSPTSQIPTTDFGNIMNQNFQNQMGVYNSQMQNWQGGIGGVLGLGGKLGAAAIMSDRKTKKNVEKMGTVFAAGQDGERKKLPVYEWQYKSDPTGERHVGPMAQDVERVDKGAVTQIGGVKHIYPDRVMGSILRAA